METQVVSAEKGFDSGSLPPTFSILPWQLPAWHQIVQARHTGRLHHAYLINGLSGLGKLRFAYNLTHSLLCTALSKDYEPCGSCRGCHLFSVGNHPDLKLVAPDPESKSGGIKIEAIRDLLEVNALSSHAGGHKIIIISPADSMNRQAANSLLKTLEEPTKGTFLFLVTTQPSSLLPTIRSRCQGLPIFPPSEKDALSWLAKNSPGHHDHQIALKLAHGAPLAALKLSSTGLLKQRKEAFDAFFGLATGRSDPLSVAESWNQQDLQLLLTWLSSWLADMLRLKTGACNVRLDNQDLTGAIAQQGSSINAAELHRMWSKVIEVKWQLRTNLDQLLLLETLLIYWSEMQSWA